MKLKKVYKLMLMGIASSLAFTSCGVMNKYKTPKVDTENLYRDNTSTDSTTIADIAWKDYFSDTILQGYISEALTNNYDMLIASERIKQAEAQLGQARAAYLPSVALTGEVEQTRLSNADPLTGTPMPKNTLAYHTESYSLGIAASWELDLWGKMNRQSKAKYASMLSSYAGRNLVQTNLIASIASSYYSLLALDQQLQVTKEMIVLMEGSLETTLALQEAGMANGAAVEQTRATLNSTKATVPDLESSIRQTENAICTMLGRVPSHLVRSSLNEQHVATQLTLGVPAQMLARRPDVQQAELSFRSAFELTNAAQASFYPSITLSSGIIGYSITNGLGNFFKAENLFSNIVAGLTQPIFAKKQLITQYKVAKADQQAALLTFRKTVLSAGQEVSDILYTYESSLKKNEIRNVQVEAEKKSVDYTKDLMQAGEANYLEVISAQQGLLNSQLSQINDKLQQLQASSNLYRALGGGVK
ncbi:MAG: efflux system, outer rane lipoprotein, NodT family [Bacteroidetes bacterium]|nr:efflux system, outer rane lipoprotein, NodT family [Bacteroidota bacterium]